MKKIIDLSIVIPAKNEEKLLPRLLESILGQSVMPKEVIVADANSTDNTIQVCHKYKVTVVKGGIIPVGRNNGAKVVTAKYILFLDADSVLLSTSTLELFYQFMVENQIESASAELSAIFEDKVGFLRKKLVETVFSMWNFLKSRNLKAKSATDSGTGICIEKKIFQKLGGFYEGAEIIGEDSEFTQRAIQSGAKYGVFRQEKVGSSGRRYKTILGTFKLLIGTVFFYIFFSSNSLKFVENNKKLAAFFLKLYGPLGG